MLNLKLVLAKFYNRYKKSLLFASSTFIVQGLNAITLPLFTRLLSQADYGILGATNSAQNFSTAIFRLGTQQSVLKQYIEFNEKEKKHYLFSVILFSQVWAIVLLFIFWFINVLLNVELFKGVPFYPYLSIAILTSAFSTSYAIFQGYLRVLNIAKTFIAITVFYVISSITLSIILITQYNLGALGKLLGGLIPYILTFIYIAFKTISKFKIKYWLDAIRFGYPLAISSIIFSIIMIYTISYLTRQISLVELGIYNIGRNLGLLIPDFIFQSLILTYQPFIYKKLRQNGIDEITKQNTLILLGLFILIFLAGLMGKQIILIFTTSKYLESLTLMRLFLLSYTFKAIYFFPMLILFYNNKTMLYTQIELGASIIFAITIHIFVPWLSIEGVGVAVIIQEIVKMIFIVHKSKLRLNQILDFAKIKSL